MAKTCYRGELYYADLGEGVGSEQEGCRPVIILQNDMGNRYSPTTIAAPISCKIDTKAKLPTHYILGPVAGLVRPSVVLLEQIRVIDKHRLERKLGSLSDRHIAGIEKALKVSMGLLDSTGSIHLCGTCVRNFRNTSAFSLHRTSRHRKEQCSFCKNRMGFEYEIAACKIDK